MSTSEGKSKGGRPSKYKEEYNDQVEKLCRLGATDKEIADFFNVCEATINNWKIDEPMFLESLKRGKAISDMNVADSLYKRATGYSHPDTKFATHEGKITDREEYTKHYAPDPTACFFWLKNRQPEKWRDKQDIEHSGNVAIDDLRKLSTEELKERAKLIQIINQNQKQ